MYNLLKEYSEKITCRKSYWIPLLFFTFGAYGFSMLNRTLSPDDLATPLYVNGTVWLAELRWGAVLWKKLLAFGECVPFLDKFLSVCFLMLGGTAFSCLFYAMNGKRDRVWLYTIAACSFITFPILSEIWEYTCGGTLIVPGDFFCAFLLLLWLLCRKQAMDAGTSPAAPVVWKTGRGGAYSRRPSALFMTARTLFLAGFFLTPVITSAESIAPVYVATVLMLLFYRYCVQETRPEHKAAWFWEGVYFAVPLVIAFILRLVIGYGIMAVLHLKFQHTGATRIEWPLSGAELAAFFKGIFIDYGVAALINLPITVFIVCAVLFAIRCFVIAARRWSPLPVFLGVCIGVSLFLIAWIQGAVMYYRTAITLMPFCAFAFYLHAEDFYGWINDGILRRRPLRAALGRCGIVLLLFITWRQAAHTHRFLALNNLRYDNEAAVMQQIGYTLSTEYDTSKPLIFVGNFSNGDASYAATHGDKDSWNGSLYRRIRARIDGTPTWRSPALVQTTVASAIDFYHWEFDGQLMGEFLSYFGYDFEVKALSRKELAPYNEEALALGMKPFQIRDRGDYILICLGRLED